MNAENHDSFGWRGVRCVDAGSMDAAESSDAALSKDADLPRRAAFVPWHVGKGIRARQMRIAGRRRCYADTAVDGATDARRA